MAHWLLQASPKEFDLLAALLAGRPPTRFSIAVHREHVQPGDDLAFWVPGGDAGVYALGTATGPAFEGTGEGPYWTDRRRRRRSVPSSLARSQQSSLTRRCPRPTCARTAASSVRSSSACRTGPTPWPLSSAEWAAIQDHAGLTDEE